MIIFIPNSSVCKSMQSGISGLEGVLIAVRDSKQTRVERDPRVPHDRDMSVRWRRLDPTHAYDLELFAISFAVSTLMKVTTSGFCVPCHMGVRTLQPSHSSDTLTTTYPTGQ